MRAARRVDKPHCWMKTTAIDKTKPCKWRSGYDDGNLASMTAHSSVSPKAVGIDGQNISVKRRKS